MQALGKHRRYPARSPAFFAMNEAACTNKEASKPRLKSPSKFDHAATPKRWKYIRCNITYAIDTIEVDSLRNVM